MVIYLIGTLLVVAGLAYGADRGIVKTRQKDPAQ
jgi:hypothetical protein